MLKSKITRTIALLLSCVIVGGIADTVAEISRTKLEQYDGRDYYAQIEGMYDQENQIAVKLWAISTMYLRNLDDKGNFQGTDALKDQTIEALVNLGCMNEKNELVLTDAEGFEFYAAYGNNKFSNTNKGYDDLKGDYSIGRSNLSTGFAYSFNSLDLNWFETNYGMTYYYLNGDGVALFDFDTSGLDYYIDELGAKVYYKKDGTTPFPYDYVEGDRLDVDRDSMLSDKINGYFVAKPKEAASEKTTAPPKRYSSEEYDYYMANQSYESDSGYEVGDRYIPEPKDGLYFYNSENGGFFKVVENEFTKTEGDRSKIYIAVSPKPETVADYETYRSAREEFNNQAKKRLIELIPFAVLAVMLAAFFVIMSGYDTKEKKYKLSSVDKIFAEIPAFLAIFFFFAGLIFVDPYGVTDIDVGSELIKLYGNDVYFVIMSIYHGVIFGLIVLMANTIILRLKCRSLLKTSLTGQVILFIHGKLKKLMGHIKSGMISHKEITNDKFLKRFFSRIGLAFAAEAFIALITVGMEAYMLFFICSMLILALYIWLNMSDMKSLTRLNEHIAAIASGNYADHAESPDSAIYGATLRLNNISAGMQDAVDKQISSERMKIDLVTNVSHDLKTPLTSIISYVDLLSKEELPPAAMDYVKIIETKADRLKAMVADLFDLAKATSRTDVSLEQIDAVVLTRQVLGDLADKTEASGKVLKVDIQAETAPIKADGKRMYRVFQNLIDNALKYSLDGTRIYLTLKNEDGRCHISVKNIASYEMTFTPEEIMERFARGDESRSTEGNGLGLSIAKSFTEACGGEFTIDIDGDLFTANLFFSSELIPVRSSEFGVRS